MESTSAEEKEEEESEDDYFHLGGMVNEVVLTAIIAAAVLTWGGFSPGLDSYLYAMKLSTGALLAREVVGELRHQLLF